MRKTVAITPILKKLHAFHSATVYQYFMRRLYRLGLKSLRMMKRQIFTLMNSFHHLNSRWIGMQLMSLPKSIVVVRLDVRAANHRPSKSRCPLSCRRHTKWRQTHLVRNFEKRSSYNNNIEIAIHQTHQHSWRELSWDESSIIDILLQRRLDLILLTIWISSFLLLFYQVHLIWNKRRVQLLMY